MATSSLSLSLAYRRACQCLETAIATVVRSSLNRNDANCNARPVSEHAALTMHQSSRAAGVQCSSIMPLSPTTSLSVRTGMPCNSGVQIASGVSQGWQVPVGVLLLSFEGVGGVCSRPMGYVSFFFFRGAGCSGPDMTTLRGAVESAWHNALLISSMVAWD